MQNNKIPQRRSKARSDFQDKLCTFTFPSMTTAMKAQGLLALSGIQTNVIKVNSSRSGSGCAFGISYQCDLDSEVMRVLNENGMSGNTVRRTK